MGRRRPKRGMSQSSLVVIKEMPRHMSPTMPKEEKRRYFYNKETQNHEDRALERLHTSMEEKKPFTISPEKI